MSPRPLGYATLAVLQALADGHHYGFDVIDRTGLASGTVYPALSTLARKRFVESRWEAAGSAHSDGRPRRKYYRVTAEGSDALREAMQRFQSIGLRTPVVASKTTG